YEERIQSLDRQARLLSDILPDDHDLWISGIAGGWQLRPAGGLLRSLRQGAAFVATRLKRRPEIPVDRPLTELKQSCVSGCALSQQPLSHRAKGTKTGDAPYLGGLAG